jgi:hypothetical protein
MKGEKMNIFKLVICALLFASLTTEIKAGQSPSIKLEDLLVKVERDPQVRLDAWSLAGTMNLPALVYLPGGVIIQALDIENSKPVYGVITNTAHPFSGGRTMFYDEAANIYNITSGKIYYSNANVVDNTGGMFEPVLESSNGLLLLVPDWTLDKVLAFDAATGNIVDTSFIPPSNPQLQSPKHVLQAPWGKILVSDQISDAVQQFDTNGTYIGVFAPAGGPNPSILDNIRGIAFRRNNNLLVTVGSSANQNTVQQFNTAGVNMGAFITGMPSPFDILYRPSDMLVSGSSSPDINRYDTLGTFISTFFSGSQLVFAQQMYRMANGDIAVAGFSSPSGIVILSSTGTYIRTLTGVTGNRGVWVLANGNFLTTNAAGIHEIDDTTGSLVRTILTGANFQYMGLYDPNLVVGTNNHQMEIPDSYRLYENYPNPFNPVTRIRFSLPESGFVTLTVFDAAGKEVRTLVNNQYNAGTYDVDFDAQGLASGLYFYMIAVNGFTEVNKMVLIK